MKHVVLNIITITKLFFIIVENLKRFNYGTNNYVIAIYSVKLHYNAIK